MTVPTETLREWYQPPDHMLNQQQILEFFSTSHLENLIHFTTEDDDIAEHVPDFIHYLIDMTVLEVPHLSDAWELSSGGLNDMENGGYAPYLAGNGTFDSSFPILIYRKQDEPVVATTCKAWLALRPDPSEEHLEAPQT